MGRHQKIAGLAPDHLHRPAPEASGQARLVTAQGIGGGRGEVRERVGADGDGQGHGLSLGHVVLLKDLAQMARGPRKAGQVVRVVDHETVHAPVDPAAVHVLRDDQVPGAQVTAAVALVEHGGGQVEEVGLCTHADDLLARRFLAPPPDRWGCSLPSRRLRRSPAPWPWEASPRAMAMRRQVATGLTKTETSSDVVRHALEPHRRTVLLTGQPADGAELQVPGHLLLHLHKVAGLPQGLDKVAIVVENHGGKRKVPVPRLQARAPSSPGPSTTHSGLLGVSVVTDSPHLDTVLHAQGPDQLAG